MVLQGKAVVITGSGRGIGAAPAARAARLGARVVVNDVDGDVAEATAAAIRAAGGEAVAIAADITQWDEAGRLIAGCVEAFGRIDGLVNNAGLFRMGRIDELDPEHVTAMFAVNINGAAYCASHAVRRMIPQGSGTIVNLVSGAQMGLPTMGAYGATKGALATFTYAWAAELGAKGIRVNAVSPMADTRMVDTTMAYQQSHHLPVFAREQPAAEDNAPAICFLLSDLSSGLNGQVLRSEGRQIALIAHPVIIDPPLERDRWDEQAIAAAFDETLGRHLSPIGIASARVEPVGGGSAFWKTRT